MIETHCTCGIRAQVITRKVRKARVRVNDILSSRIFNPQMLCGRELGDEAADMAVGWLSLLQRERLSEPAVRCALAGLCAAVVVCCVPRYFGREPGKRRSRFPKRAPYKTPFHTTVVLRQHLTRMRLPTLSSEFSA